MKGLITERDLEQAEQSFHGITRFFEKLAVKPGTFLELVARFDHWTEAGGQLFTAMPSSLMRR